VASGCVSGSVMVRVGLITATVGLFGKVLGLGGGSCPGTTAGCTVSFNSFQVVPKPGTGLLVWCGLLSLAFQRQHTNGRRLRLRVRRRQRPASAAAASSPRYASSSPGSGKLARLPIVPSKVQSSTTAQTRIKLVS
jgi:hypothetical protein